MFAHSPLPPAASINRKTAPPPLQTQTKQNDHNRRREWGALRGAVPDGAARRGADQLFPMGVAKKTTGGRPSWGAALGLRQRRGMHLWFRLWFRMHIWRQWAAGCDRSAQRWHWASN